MKSTALIGIVLIVLGVIALAYQGFSYTEEKTVLDIGPVEATAETQERVPIPPIIGGAAVIGGVVLVISGVKK